MVLIGGNEIVFGEHPQRAGTFLWKSSSGFLDLVTVVYIPPKDEYGMSWEGYYAVAGQRLRNVLKLRGTFAEITIEG